MTRRAVARLDSRVALRVDTRTVKSTILGNQADTTPGRRVIWGKERRVGELQTATAAQTRQVELSSEAICMRVFAPGTRRG